MAIVKNPKYEMLPNDTISWNGKTLHRIKALRKFADVAKGQLGGYIESEKNLSHASTCWVYDNAKVYGNAKVTGKAKIFDDAQVYGNADVYGDAEIRDDAKIFDDAQVYDKAAVFGDAMIFGNAEVYGDAWVYGNVCVYDNALVHGKARVHGNASIGSNADIEKSSDVFLVTNVGDEVETLTVYKGPTGLLASIGNFDGSTEEFLAKAKDFYNEKQYKEFELLVQLAEGRILG